VVNDPVEIDHDLTSLNFACLSFTAI
jgi:hypothetical protein